MNTVHCFGGFQNMGGTGTEKTTNIVIANNFAETKQNKPKKIKKYPQLL